MPLSVYAPFRLCSFPFMPLSVYAPFRFVKYSILPNSFLPLSVYASFRIERKLIMLNSFLPLSVYAPFRFDQYLIMPFSFMPLSFMLLSVSAPFCLCPFSVYAPFRIDGNNRLCWIPLCQLPASPSGSTVPRQPQPKQCSTILPRLPENAKIRCFLRNSVFHIYVPMLQRSMI
jgi:hypothetical protein